MKALSPDTIDKIKALKSQGKRNAEIQRELNVSDRSISKFAPAYKRPEFKKKESNNTFFDYRSSPF